MKEVFSPIVWKEIKPKIGPTYYRGMLGKVPVAIIQWRGSAVDPTHPYTVNFSLPGIQTPQSGQPDVDTAKTVVADEVNAWLEAAGLEVSDVTEG